MKLVVTIDTEEDNWGDYRPDGHTLRNIERIPELQRLFDKFAVRPTYLISYPVAADDRAVSLLKEIQERGGCEIGTHCHPWNTPPFEEETNAKNSMLCNLPGLLQYRKIETLHNLIRQRFGTFPTSFRSGRWGYGPEVARSLQALGYTVDSSVTPYTSWRDDHGPDYAGVGPRPYLFTPDDPYTSVDSGEKSVVEIPATIGYLQKHYDQCNRILQMVTRNPIKRFRLDVVLFKLRLINRVWLCPEFFDGEWMINLVRTMINEGYPVLNLFFHSTTLQAGLTPFVENRDDERRFLERIKSVLAFAKEAGIDSTTLSEAAGLIRKDAGRSPVRPPVLSGGGR